MTSAPTSRWKDARPSLAPRSMPPVSGLPRESRQEIVATIVQALRAPMAKRSRMASSAQPARVISAVEIDDGGGADVLQYAALAGVEG